MKARTLIGLSALFFLALSLNLLVWRGGLFNAATLAPLSLALLLAVVWLIMLGIDAAAHQAARRGRAVGGLNAFAASFLFLMICVVIFAFFKQWNASWDLTAEGRRDLADQTVQVLQTMTEEVEVFCFFLNVDDDLVLIARDKTRRFLEQCREHTDLLKVKFLDPQVDVPQLMDLDLKTHVSTQGTVVIRVAGNRKDKRVITLSGGSPRLEERDFTRALISVLRSANPKVGYLTGHRERDIIDQDPARGASGLGNLLRAESYEVERIAIPLAAPVIPADVDVLLINEPKDDLTPEEAKAIGRYLDRGGRMLLLMGPRRSARQGFEQAEVLRPWLKERYNIDLGDNVAITDHYGAKSSPIDVQLRADTAPFQDVDDDPGTWRGCFRADQLITERFDQVMLLRWARTVRFTEAPDRGLLGSALLRTTPDYWAETDIRRLMEKGQTRKDAGDPEGPLPLAVAVTASTADARPDGGKPARSRIVVVGNSEFLANGMLAGDGGIPGHLNFILNAMNWLSGTEDLIAIRATGTEDPPVILTPMEERGIVWFSTLLTTQLVVLAGVLAYMLRRRSQ